MMDLSKIRNQLVQRIVRLSPPRATRPHARRAGLQCLACVPEMHQLKLVAGVLVSAVRVQLPIRLLE